MGGEHIGQEAHLAVLAKPAETTHAAQPEQDGPSNALRSPNRAGTRVHPVVVDIETNG